MPYLKQVTIKGNKYYYLFHTVREGDKYKKLSRYIGKEKPSKDELERMKREFHAKRQPAKKMKARPNVVAILQELQKKNGYLTNEEMIRVSKEKNIPGVNIYGVATFYSQFKLKKSGKYIISVCRGTACHVKGSDKLLQYLEEIIGIKTGETTEDGKFTLECVNCIGACAKAPAMMINDEVYGELDKTKVKKIIEALK